MNTIVRATVNVINVINVETPCNGVSTLTVASETNKFRPQSKNLASIVRGFKSSVTKYAHLIDADFQWQSRYYVHIIRDAESFERIRQYIANNPLHWEEDKFNNI